eukprot:324316-Amphidinium_carterae.1
MSIAMGRVFEYAHHTADSASYHKPLVLRCIAKKVEKTCLEQVAQSLYCCTMYTQYPPEVASGQATHLSHDVVTRLPRLLEQRSRLLSLDTFRPISAGQLEGGPLMLKTAFARVQKGYERTHMCACVHFEAYLKQLGHKCTAAEHCLKNDNMNTIMTGSGRSEVLQNMMMCQCGSQCRSNHHSAENK